MLGSSGPRIVFFGSGSPMSVAALGALLDSYAVAAVVVPYSKRSMLRRWHGSENPLRRLARERERDIITFRPGEDRLPVVIASLRPDLYCVASFPHILDRSLLHIPRIGALNVHPSLLPRHRGPDPLFWTYFMDDATTGVTIHWMDEGIDSGDIVLQKSFVLARGRPSGEVHEELSRIGAALLVEAIRMLEEGTAVRIHQDATLATHEPRAIGGWRVDFESWPAERVWHFLHGLSDRETELLLDLEGKLVPHGPARHWQICAHNRAAGFIEKVDYQLRVYCKDGVIDLDLPSLRSRVRPLLRDLRRRIRR